MIDTDKYEGHYTDDFVRFWVTADDKLNADIERAMATAYLIQDAPLLLAEVKRLREKLGETEYRLEMAEDVLGYSVWFSVYSERIKEKVKE